MCGLCVVFWFGSDFFTFFFVSFGLILSKRIIKESLNLKGISAGQPVSPPAQKKVKAGFRPDFAKLFCHQDLEDFEEQIFTASLSNLFVCLIILIVVYFLYLYSELA